MRSQYEFLNLDNAKHPEQAELEECDQDYWWLSESVEEKDVCPLKYLTLIDCPIKYVNVSDQSSIFTHETNMLISLLEWDS